MREITARTVVVGSGCAGLNAADTLAALGEKSLLLVTEDMNAGTSRNTGSDKQTYYKLSLSGDEGDSVGELAHDLHYPDVNGDTAVLRSNMLPACETYKLAANKTFTASSSPTENDEAGCFVSEGDTVKITGCYISDGNVSFGIECKGNTGWVSRDVSSGYAEPLFRAK